MSDPIHEVKAFVSAQLQAHCEPVPSKTATSQKKHLSVWMPRGRRRPIGAELDHDGIVNLWVLSMYSPAMIPETVLVTKKVWKGSTWQDKESDPARAGHDGANSNLKGYEEFRTKPITRLGLRSIEDARAILDQLFS